MKDLRVIFFGTDSFVVSVLEVLDNNSNLVGVVTVASSPVEINTPPYSCNADGTDCQPITILTPTKLDQEVVLSLQNLKPDVIVVASYGKIIPKSILEIPKYGALNIHPSLLPKYRGPSPVPNTILNGDKETGVTIIKMDEKMDHGPIVYTKVISLSGQENLQVLINKLFQAGADLLVDILPRFISGKIKQKEQNHEQATFTKLMTKENGYFDIDNPPPPEKLDRMIRAYYPWPGVWTRWNGKIVKFYPGNLVQMEGKKSTRIEDFLHGYPDFPLKCFG